MVVTNGPQSFSWEGYGLKLHIPQGCLPAGVEQCTINIKVSLAGQYEFPENTHPVSAVFWLRCEPRCKFVVPVSVEIQHCARPENISKLSFVKAVCSQESLPYTFRRQRGGRFTSSSSYGVLELESFSGAGITQEGSEDREYIARLFYQNQTVKSCDIHLVVTWNIEAYLAVSFIIDPAIQSSFKYSVIPCFLVIRRISLVSAYSLISACYFAGLTTSY